MNLLISVALAVFLIAASVTIQPEQESFGWVLFAALLALFAVKKVHGLFGRVLFISLGAFITLRYLLFRIFFTLQIELTPTFIFAFLLFMAECYAIGTHFLGLFLNIKPLDRVLPPVPDTLPSIDIFIPTYDEDEEVALTTALACKNFDYPKELLNIYILDDGSRLPRINKAELREALWQRYNRLKSEAEGAGVGYLTREDGELAKAGMIRAAFTGRAVSALRQAADGTIQGESQVQTSGDLLLILDCDHIPTRDMLKKLVGYFMDAKVFLVQTPHFMLNADPLRKNIQGEQKIPCESWLFYQSIMKGLDSWNGAIFCGSAALLRRSALEEVGGLCGETITEDAETALALHSRGYKSVYTSDPYVAGLAPESIPDMLRQRARWCQGMLQMLLLKNPLLHKGLSLPQRLSYFNCCLYWLFPLFRTIFLLAPLAFLFFGFNIYNASTSQVISFAAPHLMASVLVAGYLYPRLRPFPMDDILEIFQTFFLLPAIVAVLLSPRKPVFKTTRKGVQLEKDTPSAYAWPLLFVLVLIAGGLAIGLHTWQSTPFLREALAITLAWNLLNGLFVLCTVGGMFERRQRRASHRFTVNESVALDGIPGTLCNLSGTGFHLVLTGPSPALGQECQFDCADFSGRVHIVRSEESRVSGTFTPSQEVVNFVYGDSSRWRQQIRSTLACEGMFGSLTLIRLCFASVWRFFGGAVRRLISLCLGILITLLAPCLAGAETFQLPVSGQIRQDSYVLEDPRGVIRIPIHLSRRRTTNSVLLDLRYATDCEPGSLHPTLNLNVDGVVLPGKVTRLSETDYQIRFTLPEDKLGPGDRTLSLAVEQSPPDDGRPMRTRLDLSGSTVTINSELNELSDDIKDFAVLFDPKAAGAIPLHVVLGKLDEAHLLRAIKAVQTLAIMLQNRPLDISASFSPVEGRDNLLIGDTKAHFTRLTPDRRHVLLRETDLADVQPQPPATVLLRGSSRTFRSFGLDTLLFRPGHTMRNTPFIIPSETRLTPNRMLTLSLDVAYSAGLAAGSRLEVFMNGSALAWIPLRNPEGAHYDNYTLEVPTSRLKKGVNTLGLLPRLRPASVNEDARNMQLFATVFNTSSLSLPDTGIYVRLPELSTLLTDGYPFRSNAIVYLVHPEPDTAAALLNIAALIGQRRGSIGQNITLRFGPWMKESRYTYIFDVDPKQAPSTFLLDESFIVPADKTIALRLIAPSAGDLLRGTQQLWKSEIQSRVHGESVLLNLDTGEVTHSEGDTLIISDVWPFPSLTFYTNNFPQVTRVAVGAAILLFSLIAWGIIKRRNL